MKEFFIALSKILDERHLKLQRDYLHCSFKIVEIMDYLAAVIFNEGFSQILGVKKNWRCKLVSRLWITLAKSMGKTPVLPIDSVGAKRGENGAKCPFWRNWMPAVWRWYRSVSSQVVKYQTLSVTKTLNAFFSKLFFLVLKLA